MGVQHTYGTAGATGGGFSSQSGSLQPSYEELAQTHMWSWQARGPKTWKDKNRWNSLWSFGCRMTGGGDVHGSDGSPPVSNAMASKDLFEPFSCDGEGSQSVNFLKGVTRDSAGAVLGSAIVQGLVTATDVFLGQVTSHPTDGTYTLGMQVDKATPLYAVAYKAGSPDVAGTTVNTLLATNVDGT